MDGLRTDDVGGSRVLRAGPLTVWEDGSGARLGDRRLSLTYAQCRVLAALARRAGRIGRRCELYEEAFGRSPPEGSRAIDVHVARIRTALGAAAKCIVSVDRVGYRVDVEWLSTFAPPPGHDRRDGNDAVTSRSSETSP